MSSPFPHKYQPSSGLSSSLLMKTSCLRLKLVELNFFASFNADDQRKKLMYLTYLNTKHVIPCYHFYPCHFDLYIKFCALRLRWSRCFATADSKLLLDNVWMLQMKDTVTSDVCELVLFSKCMCVCVSVCLRVRVSAGVTGKHIPPRDIIPMGIDSLWKS